MAQILSMQENLDKIDSWRFDDNCKNIIKNTIRSLYGPESSLTSPPFVMMIVSLLEDSEIHTGVEILVVGEFYDTNVTITFKP